MPANGPIVTCASPVDITTAGANEQALVAVNGVNFSEELGTAIIRGLVAAAADASATDVVVTLYEGPALTGSALGQFTASPTDVAAAEIVSIPVAYTLSRPPSADVEYSLSIASSSAGAGYEVFVYEFSATVIPGGVVNLPV